MESKEKTTGSTILKTLMYLIVIGFFVWVVVKNIGSYEVLVRTIKDAQWIFIGYTALIGIGNLATYSFIFKKSFNIISEESDFPNLLNKTLIFQFFSVSTPIGVAGGNAYITRYLVRQGMSHIKAFFGILIANLFVNISFLLILAVTIIYLRSTNHLEQYQEIASILLLLLNVGILVPMLLFAMLPGTSAKIAHFVVTLINSLTKTVIKKEVFNANSLDSYIIEAMLMSKRFDKSIALFAKGLPLALTYHLINVLTLFLAFYAFGDVISIVKLFSLYGVIVLFTIISPTPYGIGIVEGLAHTAAISMGLDSSISLVAILTYRVSVLWLPALIGLFTLRKSNERDI